MPIQYVNRLGKTYFLRQDKTKTGKPKWLFSTKKEGDLAEAIPEGYEIYENHNAQVFLRKKIPKLITEDEVAIVESGLRNLAKRTYFFLDVKKDSIIVYLAHQNTEFLEGSVQARFGPKDRAALEAETQKFLTYLPMMCFTLVDEQKRLFSVDRWCFRGSIDDWIALAKADGLSKQVKKYVPHLSQESFFELM